LNSGALLAWCLVCVGVQPTSAQTTTLIVHHNANLRADHSTQSAIKDHDHGLVFAKPWDEIGRTMDTLGHPLRSTTSAIESSRRW
jgi:hypothetical protein